MRSMGSVRRTFTSLEPVRIVVTISIALKFKLGFKFDLSHAFEFKLRLKFDFGSSSEGGKDS